MAKLTSIMSLGLILLASCDHGSVAKTDAQTSAEAQSYTLTKVSQRTQRFDCQGHLTSDQIEMQSSPIQELTINPKTTTHLYSLSVTNTTNDQPARSIIGQTSFWIDCGDGALSLWVNQGDNILSYQFYYCDQLSLDPNGQPTQTCQTSPTIGEAGSFHINVVCAEKTLDGIQQIHPTPADCATTEN